jgi:hypothetical protein
MNVMSHHVTNVPVWVAVECTCKLGQPARKPVAPMHQLVGYWQIGDGTKPTKGKQAPEYL